MSSTAGQVIKCKAAVAWEAGKPLVIEEVEVAPPEAGEVRLKILYTSLCHTDVYFWEAKGQTPLFPRIFGHEAGGIVESVGEGVTHLKPGDHALPVFTGECGECPHCKSEESNMCDLLRINTDRGVMIHDSQTRFSIRGQPIYHFVGTSTFSEYTVVHAGCVAKVNPAAPLDKICVLSCGICTGLGATINVAKPKPGSSVAIFGLGAVGLAAAEGARISGASRIIGVDLVSSRFEEAKKFGVNEFVNPKDHDKPVQQVIAEMTNGGVDRAVECTGSIQAMISAFECVHDGWGVAVLVGVPNKDDAFKTHPVNFLNERTLKGTFYGNYKPRTDLPSVVEKYMNGDLELDKFITHTVPFSEINKAFDYMLKGGERNTNYHQNKPMGSIISSLLGGDAAAANAPSYSGETSRVQAFHSSARWQLHFNELKESSSLVVIDFSASWCGPCKFIEPAIHAMAEKFTDVEFIKIDVDELSDVAQEFQVQAMPTFVLLKKGKEIDRVVGAKKDELERKVQKSRAA